jgi:hypothetical protein
LNDNPGNSINPSAQINASSPLCFLTPFMLDLNDRTLLEGDL